MVDAHRGPVINISKALVFLSVLGIVISLYLTQNHYAVIADPGALSFCDFSDSFNCSEVNSSEYAEVLNTPIALLGVLYFFVTLIFSSRSLRDDNWYRHLLVTFILGFFFVLYLLYAEWVLGVVCVFCTILHLIILSGAILSWIAVRRTLSWRKNILREYSWKVFWFVIVGFVIVGFSNLPTISRSNVSLSFGKCLSDSGLVEYGSFTCSACIAQKRLLGPAFSAVNYVECHPEGPNADIARCKRVPITSTPSWVMEVNGSIVEKRVGVQTIESLAVWSGCPLSEKK